MEGRHRVRRRGRPQEDTTASLTTTGTHRAVGRRRGVAAWPIACVILLGLLVAGWFGWNWADGVLESRAAAKAADCQRGELTLDIAVDPVLDAPVTTAADRWNAAKTIVREHCVHVEVHPAASAEVEAVLAGTAEPTAIGGYPAAWLPDSTARIETLTAEHPELVGSSGLTIASDADGELAYLTLAGENVDEAAQHAAQSFQKFLLQPAQQNAFADAGLTPAH